MSGWLARVADPALTDQAVVHARPRWVPGPTATQHRPQPGCTSDLFQPGEDPRIIMAAETRWNSCCKGLHNVLMLRYGNARSTTARGRRPRNCIWFLAQAAFLALSRSSSLPLVRSTGAGSIPSTH